MEGIKEIRAPRLNGDLQRPEILIRPHMDLAADLGVTTAALSQTIRIATIGDIDQNSAKFSLSDRQIPIRVSIAEESRKNLANIRSEEHTSELQSLMRISYAVFCLKTKHNPKTNNTTNQQDKE